MPADTTTVSLPAATAEAPVARRQRLPDEAAGAREAEMPPAPQKGPRSRAGRGYAGRCFCCCRSP